MNLFSPPLAGVSDVQSDMLKICQFFFLSTFKASVSKDCSDQRLEYCYFDVCISFNSILTVTVLSYFCSSIFLKSNPVKLLLQQGCKLLCKFVGLTKLGRYGSKTQNLL